MCGLHGAFGVFAQNSSLGSRPQFNRSVFCRLRCGWGQLPQTFALTARTASLHLPLGCSERRGCGVWLSVWPHSPPWCQHLCHFSGVTKVQCSKPPTKPQCTQPAGLLICWGSAGCLLGSSADLGWALLQGRGPAGCGLAAHWA